MKRIIYAVAKTFNNHSCNQPLPMLLQQQNRRSCNKNIINFVATSCSTIHTRCRNNERVWIYRVLKDDICLENHGRGYCEQVTVYF